MRVGVLIKMSTEERDDLRRLARLRTTGDRSVTMSELVRGWLARETAKQRRKGRH